MRFGLIVLVALAIPAAAAAQKSKRKCTGTPPDTTMHLALPIYRDCEVDKPAKVRGEEPRPELSALTTRAPRSGCLRAEFEFVVDSLGFVERSTVQPQSGNDRDLESAVSATLGQLRYEPARLDGHPVRQLVIYKVMVGMVTRVVSSSGPVGLPPTDFRPPRC